MSHSPRIIQGSVARARSLRERGTEAEQILWQKLRNRRFHGLKFRRQVPMGPYIADLYCAEKGLVVEIDGFGHEYKKMADQRRDAFMISKNLRVLRLSNTQIKDSLDAALLKIASTCGVQLTKSDFLSLQFQ